MPQSEKQSAEWLEGVRIGGIEALSHFRVLLHQRKPLSEDDRQGLIDLLDYTSDHLQAMWTFVDEELVEQEVQVALTSRAGLRARQYDLVDSMMRELKTEMVRLAQYEKEESEV